MACSSSATPERPPTCQCGQKCSTFWKEMETSGKHCLYAAKGTRTPPSRCRRLMTSCFSLQREDVTRDATCGSIAGIPASTDAIRTCFTTPSHVSNRAGDRKRAVTIHALAPAAWTARSSATTLLSMSTCLAGMCDDGLNATGHRTCRKFAATCRWSDGFEDAATPSRLHATGTWTPETLSAMLPVASCYLVVTIACASAESAIPGSKTELSSGGMVPVNIGVADRTTPALMSASARAMARSLARFAMRPVRYNALTPSATRNVKSHAHLARSSACGRVLTEASARCPVRCLARFFHARRDAARI